MSLQKKMKYNSDMIEVSFFPKIVWAVQYRVQSFYSPRSFDVLS